MDNLKLDEYNYKGKLIKMPKNSKKSVSNPDDSKYTIPKSVILTVVGWAIVLFTGVMGWLCVQLYELNATVKTNSNSIANLEEQIKSTNNDILNLTNKIEHINFAADYIINASKEMSSSLNSVAVRANTVPNVTSSPIGYLHRHRFIR